MEDDKDKDQATEIPAISDEDGEEVLSEIRDQYEQESASPAAEAPQPPRPQAQPPVQTSRPERQDDEQRQRSIEELIDEAFRIPGQPLTIDQQARRATQVRQARQAAAPPSNETEAMRFAMALSRSSLTQVGAPPKHTMDSLRSTGRTTRLIAAAVRYLVEGRQVVIVAENHKGMKRLETLWHEEAIRATVLNRRSIEAPRFVTVDDPQFSWEPEPSYSGIPGAILMVDHFAIEHEFPGLVDHLHRHDPQVMVGAAGCRHLAAIATPIPQLQWCPACGSLIFDGVAYCPKAASDIEGGQRT